MVVFSLKPIIIFFVVVILGVVFLGEIADNQVENTELSSVTNELITITNTENIIINESITMSSQEGQTGNTSVISVTFFGNGTNSTHDGDINISLHVNWTTDGVITVDSVLFPAVGPYNISYVYTSDATGDTDQDDVISVSFFGNGTINTDTTGIEIGDEINFTKPGVITVSTLNFTNAIYNISYNYEGPLYVVDTKTHPLLKLLIVFFVLVIFAFGIQAIMQSSDNFNFGFKRE